MIGLAFLQALVWSTAWATASQLFRRGQGCSEIPTHTYTIDNSTFTIICNTTWDGSLFLNVMYTPNFTSCLKACVDWDDETACAGCQWDSSSPGYDDGTYTCHLLWSMPPNNLTLATFKDTVDSAQLNPRPPPVDNCLYLQTNGNTYTSFNGEIFDVFCYNEFGFSDLELTYAADFETCAEHCISWNNNPLSTQPCVGITFDWQKTGASANLSQCWVKYSMEGSGSNRTIPVHSMKLRPEYIHLTVKATKTTASANATIGNVSTITVTATGTPGFSKSSGIGGIVGGVLGGFVLGCLISAFVFSRKGGPKYTERRTQSVSSAPSAPSEHPPLTIIK